MIPVVAIALIDSSARVLMQRRKLSGAHGGLWEFPGGKVEAAESPEAALIREVEEELGIALRSDALTPLGFASRPDDPYVVLLYTCRRWDGEPVCLDGEEIGWFAADALMALAMPPLDVPLAKAVKELLERAN
ncbi:NUDIX domain-containing protein [Novosphingobium sp.]|uniref:NUDIX domain-containing protein n=1 Tax=Novosphingobium sp. TaxID=1874826 RepID=UPI0035B18DF7